jgi:DNA-binding LytR/AlgR family response regulator
MYVDHFFLSCSWCCFNGFQSGTQKGFPVSFIQCIAQFVNGKYEFVFLDSEFFSEEKTNQLGDSFYIRDDHKLVKIRLKEILFIESFREYVHLHIEQNEYIFRKTLSEIEKRLRFNDFIRVHKSYIISLDAVDAVEGNRIQIRTHKIPIGKSYKESFYQSLDLI